MPKETSKAIVLAAFGTTDPQAFVALLSLLEKLRGKLPNTEIHLAATAAFIRKTWQKRGSDADFKAKHPEIPAEVYSLSSPLAVIADLLEKGKRDITVQSLHITHGAEWSELESLAKALSKAETFKSEQVTPIADFRLGLPAFGNGDAAWMNSVAHALAPLVKIAQEQASSLLLMGHGHPHLGNSPYQQLTKVMNELYQIPVQIALVEGNPELDDVLPEVKKSSKVLLAPLMLVAGDHAKNDMAGDEPDSWLSILKEAGLEVSVHLKGLAELDSWADLCFEHINKAEKI